MTRRVWRSFAKLGDAVHAHVRSVAAHVLVLRLTCLFLVVRVLTDATSQPSRLPVALLCTIMMLSTALLTNRVAWLLVFVVMAVTVVLGWYRLDNHEWLIVYWLLACTLALAAPNRDVALSWNGGMLVGLVFTFALIWKFLGGEYLNGDFFYHTFHFDARFRYLATIMRGVDLDVIDDTRRLELVSRLIAGPGNAIVLAKSPLLEIAALVISYWVILIEGIVAVSFLAPNASRFGRARHALLLAFVGTTYVIAPVLGFASVLLIMGLATCDVGRTRLRTTYVVIVLLLQLAILLSKIVDA